MISTSIKSCSLVRSIRGSVRSLKCSIRLSLGCVCIPFHLNTFTKSTSAKMAHFAFLFQREIRCVCPDLQTGSHTDVTDVTDPELVGGPGQGNCFAEKPCHWFLVRVKPQVAIIV